MQNEFENIDKLFSSELNDFSVTPPAGVWGEISEQLNRKKAKTLPYAFSRIAASLILFLASASLGVYMFTNDAVNTSTNLANVDAQEEVTIAEEIPSAITRPLIENILSTPLVKHPIKEDKSESVISDEKQQLAIVVEDTIQSSEEKQPEIVSDETRLNSLIANAQENIEVEASKKKQKEIEEYQAHLKLLAEYNKEEDSDNSSKRKDQWSIGGQAGPQYSYRQLNSDYNSQENLNLYNNEENGLIAYAGGVNVSYSPARRLSIQSGVHYTKIGQTSPVIVVQQNTDDVIYQAIPGVGVGSEGGITTVSEPELRIASSIGGIPNPEPTSISEGTESIDAGKYANVNHVNQYMEFIEVPLIARYAIIDRKVNFHLLGGVSTNFLIGSPVYLDNGQYYSEAENINKINYSSTVGLGLGYAFTAKLVFTIEPQFKYYLNKINTGSNTEVHPYSFGVFTGFNYLF